MAEFGPLLSTDWLADHLADRDVKIVDGSWRLPGGAPAFDDYRRRCIPGAVFFDIDAIADKTSPLPHMLAPAEDFAAAVGALGLGDDDRIVIYDDGKFSSAARVWWSFRAMGHDRTAVLDGGLAKWRAEGRPVATPSRGPAAKVFNARFRPDWVLNADALRAALAAPDWAIADARPAARFRGEAPEPRPGLRAGHMPGAVSLPHSVLLDGDGTFRGAAEIKTALESAGLDLGKHIVTTCGSGVAAAVLSLALETIGCRRHGLYDGSWAEWGDARHAAEEYPVVAGG